MSVLVLSSTGPDSRRSESPNDEVQVAAEERQDQGQGEYKGARAETGWRTDAHQSHYNSQAKHSKPVSLW